MPLLTGKLGTWDLPHVHMWKDRAKEIRYLKKTIITANSRIVTIGSCFAEELADAMDRFNLNGAMHPTGLFYNTRSIRQEIERIFGGWQEYFTEPFWKGNGGFIHPFKSYYDRYQTIDELRQNSDTLDQHAERLFKSADVVVITLGLIEGWMQPDTGNFYRQIPPPEVFERINTVFYRLTVSDMIEDLRRIRSAIKENSTAEIIVTVSPVPLHSTFTSLDVRVANTESKSRIRAAVSEFVEMFPDIHYFHSYEIVTTAERQSEFMMDDGRHIHRHAVDYILQQFLLEYASDDVTIPEIDISWLSQPEKIAPRPTRESKHKTPMSRLLRYLKRS